MGRRRYVSISSGSSSPPGFLRVMDETPKPVVKVNRETKTGQNSKGQPTRMTVETTTRTWVELLKPLPQVFKYSELFGLLSVLFWPLGFATTGDLDFGAWGVVLFALLTAASSAAEKRSQDSEGRPMFYVAYR